MRETLYSYLYFLLFFAFFFFVFLLLPVVDEGSFSVAAVRLSKKSRETTLLNSGAHPRVSLLFTSTKENVKVSVSGLTPYNV